VPLPPVLLRQLRWRLLLFEQCLLRQLSRLRQRQLLQLLLLL